MVYGVGINATTQICSELPQETGSLLRVSVYLFAACFHLYLIPLVLKVIRVLSSFCIHKGWCQEPLRYQNPWMLSPLNKMV